MFACKAIPFHYTTTLRRLLSLYCATFSCYTGPDSVQLLSIVVDNGSQSHNHNTHGKSYLIHPNHRQQRVDTVEGVCNGFFGIIHVFLVP